MKKTTFPKMGTKPLYWTLDGHTPKPATREEWIDLWEGKGPDRILASWMLEDTHISTVFLGMDHNFSGSGSPVLFETMIFDGEDVHDDYQERYTSWDAAMEGHARAVAHVLAKGWPKKKEIE